MPLTYIPPQIVNGQPLVQLDRDEVEKEIEKWKCALIVYIIGEMPGYNAMKRYIALNWANTAEPKLLLHDEGYYVIKFQTLGDKNEIFYVGPYIINNKPIILKPWTADFDFSVEFPTEILLWVKFPKLPMSCWGEVSLSRIASALGKPVFADECTTKRSRISYAGMLIKVNATKALPTKIAGMDPSGKVFQQSITYDWKPKFCDTSHSWA
ncbi:uncharacterized protein [Nicotiana tomentosiformis]|uniref:uncharacterized protein n=1 Tax=Nicotiana tomentosiformis TaxID=4098 RepID=UPI00051BAAE8|nr:uncharacterized protein LOC104115535 [Nicotiana tomentosiformis]